MIADPPLLAGADQETAAVASPADAETDTGAPGTVLGITAEDGLEAGPVPEEFLAATVNVYEVPLVNPVTVQDVVDVVQVLDSGLEVTV